MTIVSCLKVFQQVNVAVVWHWKMWWAFIYFFLQYFLLFLKNASIYFLNCIKPHHQYSSFSCKQTVMDRCNLLLTFPIYRGPQSSLQFTVNLHAVQYLAVSTHAFRPVYLSFEEGVGRRSVLAVKACMMLVCILLVFASSMWCIQHLVWWEVPVKQNNNQYFWPIADCFSSMLISVGKIPKIAH